MTAPDYDVRKFENNRIIKVTRQQVWGKIAVLNFALGGSGAGFYILMFLLIHGKQFSAGLIITISN